MSLETQPLIFNPLDPAFRINPYPVYARMLREAPVYPSPLGGVVLSRYADCEGVLKNQRLWSADFRNAAENVGLGADFDVMGIERPFLFLDPPDHTRLRRLVQKAFTPRVVEELRPRVQELVDGMLDAAEAKGSLEVIEDLAYPLPVIVISEMLGVPPEDHVKFRGWSASLAKSLDPTGPLTPGGGADLQGVLQEFDTYFRGLFESPAQGPEGRPHLGAARRRGRGRQANGRRAARDVPADPGRRPRDDREPGRERDPAAAAASGRSFGCCATTRHSPSPRRRRCCASTRRCSSTGRIAMEDVGLRRHRRTRRGTPSCCLIGAANRDPDHFERPDVFDITRNDDRHLSFGFGIHYCLGAPLARIEGQIALSTVARRFPGLHLLSDEVQYKPNIVLRGLAALPVGF